MKIIINQVVIVKGNYDRDHVKVRSVNFKNEEFVISICF